MQTKAGVYMNSRDVLCKIFVHEFFFFSLVGKYCWVSRDAGGRRMLEVKVEKKECLVVWEKNVRPSPTEVAPACHTHLALPSWW